MKKHLLDELNNHHNAAKRLNIMLIGTNYNVLLMCIITKFATTDLHMNIKINPLTAILHYFLRQTELKVIKDHEAFLVNELMQDIQEISEEQGLEEQPAEFRHNNRLKEKLLDHFGEKI